MTKPNKVICAPSEVSDQHGHPPSLISLCSVLSGLRSFCWFCHEAAHFKFSNAILASHQLELGEMTWAA